jgi:uncharacterized phage-associated protein
MSFAFSSRKALQITAYVVSKRRRPTTKLELMKLLYFADRLSIQRHRHPITGDRHCALPHGPVVSRILDLINENAIRDLALWTDAIEVDKSNILHIKQDPGCDELSECEIELLDEIIRTYGPLSAKQLYDRAHLLPEWIKCHAKGNVEIPLSEIAIALGCQADLSEMEEEKELDCELAQLQGS